MGEFLYLSANISDFLLKNIHPFFHLKKSNRGKRPRIDFCRENS